MSDNIVYKKNLIVILIFLKCDDKLFTDIKFRDRLHNNSASIITYVRAIEETYTWKQYTSRLCGITECTSSAKTNQPTHTYAQHSSSCESTQLVHPKTRGS